MAIGPTLDDRAESFAQQFPAEDREGVKEWYREKLVAEHRKARRKRMRAWVAVFVLAVLMPALAFLALRFLG